MMPIGQGNRRGSKRDRKAEGGRRGWQIHGGEEEEQAETSRSGVQCL